MIKKLFTGRMTSRTNLAGKSDFSAKQVSTTLLLLLLCLLMPQKGWAELVTDAYYDFTSKGTSDTEVTYGSTNSTYSDCTNFTKIGSVGDPTRFASQNNNWILKSGNGNRQKGLLNVNNGVRKFLINNVSKGALVTFALAHRDNDDYKEITLVSSNATKDGNTVKMTSTGLLAVGIPNYTNILTITIQHDDAGTYSYDPAIEIYDLSGQNGTTFGTSSAGFQMGSENANYLTNLNSGLSLNNRVAVTIPSGSQGWTFNNGLQNNNDWTFLNLSITNLKADDRVRITYEGSGNYGNNIYFGSDPTPGGALNSEAFKDITNDGELQTDEGEHQIARDEPVENGIFYTMTEDGHLDFVVAPRLKITKIEIYSDHQAQMLDKYNGSATAGYTAYFSETGQLMAKEHIVPGGLEVQVGNTSNTDQHAIVVSSDEGPVSFVYDQSHFKMARHATWNSWNVESELPVTGTYYKFIPEVDGTMKVRFKAYSVHYNNLMGNGKDSGNEQQVSTQCPYYLMKDNNGTPSQITSQTKGNGATVTFQNISLEAGNVYYLYGWWANGNSDCGVAELIDVTFVPDKSVAPLAKWVASGTTADAELASVSGIYDSDIHIKKMSDNIESCEPYISGTTLGIRNIVFKSGTNPGGTILIKLGSPSDDAAPVFAFTIAYDAEMGHKWDFSEKSLRGLDWDNWDASTKPEAEVVDFKTADDTSGLLYKEMHEAGGHSDWTKTWRVINSAGEGTHDLMFLNKYDMEGDNADMMWDTEGLIFQTSSNQSCINNEFGGVVDHSKFGTQSDPDRYVGILPGGSFTIPALKEGDRVEIFMGSGNGSGGNACKLNITGALDAIGNAIDPTDIYNGGGSPWEYNKGSESRYRGAYQFISTGGDMTFTMNGGSMTKLYTIKIYRGAKTATVDCTRQKSVTYNNDVYDGYTYSFVNDWSTTTPAKTAITLHYRGKGERLRTPTVVHTSGNISTGSDNLFYAEVGDNNAPFIFYKSKKEDYGMFRMRVEDLELGNKYVADYALQNITVGYLEKKNYPYTWDFTDLLGYVDQETLIQREQTKVANYDPRTIDDDEAYEIEFMNNSVGEDVKAVEQWKEYDADGDIPAGYGLQINNEPYGGGCMWSGGQLYAGDQPFGETYFLSIKVPESLDNDGKLQPDINKNYNGGVRITNEGLCLTGGKWTITLPQVGTIASVYVRAKQVGNETIYAAVGDILENASFTYEGTATDGTGDKIYAVKGTGEDMKLMFNNLIIKKIAISQDPKTVNKLGYATESRNVVIDPELMGYMTGTGLKAYTVDNVTYGDNAGDVPTIRLTEIPMENVMGKATNTGDHRGYIIYNTDDAVIPEGATEGTKAVSILDGGFHLFVPDVHDDPDADSKKTILDTENGKNHLRSCYQGGSIPQEEKINGVSYTNYLMNYKYIGPDGKQHEGPEAFYRAANGASLGVNKAYLQLLTEKVKPSEANGNSGAKFAIVFVNEEQGTETTSLDGVKSTETLSGDNAIYTLSGVKVSKPEKGGIYVKNGKKFIVK